MKTKLPAIIIQRAAPWVLLSTLNLQLSTMFAQGTVFTYQGRVTDNGTNFNGAGFFEFALVTSTNTSSTATATANLTGTFVTSYNLVSGGSGYTTAPTVTISGGGGSGATATATISGGMVTAINPGSAGSGYTSIPTVTIAPPPPNIAYTTYWSNDGTSVNGSEPSAVVSVTVNSGLFTVVLGDTTQSNMMAVPAALFNLPNLQLRIWFNDGVSGFAALSPVQNLTPTPYATFASFANTASNLVGMLANGALPPSPNFSGTVIATAFSGNGAGLTALNASQLTGGTVPAAALGNAWQTGGNSGTSSDTNFLGTADNQPLELHVNQSRAFRLEPGNNTNSVVGAPNVIGGAPINFVDGNIYGATIAGGGAANMTGFMPGPSSNHVAAIFGSIGGGRLNTVSADHGTIGGGLDNTILALAYDGVIDGGSDNTIGTNATESVIGGGQNNFASGSGATVAGGELNYSTADSTTVGGGFDNTSGGNSATVAGGSYNRSLGYSATVAGGNGNLASGSWTFVGGGSDNTASNGQSTVSGGVQNVAGDYYSTVGGGIENFAGDYAATVAGGQGNQIQAGGSFSTIAGGGANTIRGSGSFIGAGANNLIQSNSGSATISGGWNNTIQTNANYSTIGGGEYNSIGNSAYEATVGGGDYNTASGVEATVSGGAGNMATNSNATVGGGLYNIAGGVGSFIGGGGYDGTAFPGNQANGNASTIVGGLGNNIPSSGTNAVIGGGCYNTASGYTATVVGGCSNSAAGNYSFAGGFQAYAPGNGSFVWNSFPSTNYPTGPNEFYVFGQNGFDVDYNNETNGGHGDRWVYIGRGHVGVISPVSVTIETWTGAYLSDGGAWTSSSDRARKENFSAVDPRSVLDRVAMLPVQTWNYTSEPPAIRHLGPIAQDFHAAFGLNGEDDKHISDVDEAGVALAAIQGLNQKWKQRRNRGTRKFKP